MRNLAALAFALSSLALFAERDTAIYRGKLTSDLNANGNRIVGVASPSAPGDAANKEYVDSHGGGGGGVDTNAVVDIIHKTVDGSAKTLPKYLHVYEADDSYPAAAAAEYYRTRGDGKVDGGCSAVRSGGFLYRNFDFPFDDRAEFVVKMSVGPNRFASVGVSQVGTNLTEAIVTSGKPSRCYKWLPGATVDGINENGVACNINVVDGDPQTSGWHTTGNLHPLGAIRWVLDHATNAQHGAEYIAENIRFPEGWKQNFHYMVADERETWIVENGHPVNTYTVRYRVMTNFPTLVPNEDFPGEWEFEPGSVLDEYGEAECPGAERWKKLAFYPYPNITNAWYTNAYRRETNPPWVSDLAEVIAYTNAIFDAWAAHDKEYFRGQTNNGIPWWQTIHTSIYDLTNRTLRVAVQEQDDWYTFAVPSAGGVKPEAVREIVDGSFIGGTNAVNVAMSEISNKLDSESIIPGTPYKASLKWENIGDGYELVMNGVPFKVYGGLFKVDSLDSIMVNGTPLSSTISWLLPVSPDRELYPNPMIFWSGSELNVNGSVSIYHGLSVAAPVIATAFNPDYWENYHAGEEHLPAYLASGDWNTADDPFAKVSQIPTVSPTDANFTNAVYVTSTNLLIRATDPTFSNAVLAVQVSSLSTNITAEVYVAATNACANLGIDPALIPQGGTLGTVGGLLVALAAAVALLSKKTKLLKSDGTAEDDFATDLLGKSVAISAMRYDRVSYTSGKLADRAVNAFTMTSNKTVQFPDAVDGKCRDLLLLVTHTDGELTLPTGNTYYGDAPTMDAGETYLIALTEIAANTWYMRTIKMEVPA